MEKFWNPTGEVIMVVYESTVYTRRYWGEVILLSRPEAASVAKPPVLGGRGAFTFFHLRIPYRLSINTHYIFFQEIQVSEYLMNISPVSLRLLSNAGAS